MTEPARAAGRLLAALAAGYAAAVVLLLRLHWHYAGLVLWLLATALLVPLALLLRRTAWSRRTTALVILGVAALLQVAALTAGPSTSDDVYRYVWDGRVQFAGVDPYAHAPQSPALADLRDSALFPDRPASECDWPIPDGCSLINRPAVRTVYPPAAQLVFDGVRLVTFGHGGVRAFQVLGALGVLAVAALLLEVTRRRRQTPWPVAIWAWSPVAVLEYGNNAHLDWVAALLGLGALLAAGARRPARAGLLLALTTLTKLYPVLLAPSMVRRRPAVVAGVAIAVAVLLYLPHVLAVGTDVVGYLPGYLGEEGYDSGSRLLLLGTVLPHPVDTVVGGLVLVAVALWVLRHADPDAPERTAVLLLGAAFLVTTPAYGWYAGLLLAVCVFARRLEWLPVAMAGGVVYLLRTEVTHDSLPAAGIYLLAALLTLTAARRRTREPVAA